MVVARVSWEVQRHEDSVYGVAALNVFEAPQAI